MPYLYVIYLSIVNSVWHCVIYRRFASFQFDWLLGRVEIECEYIYHRKYVTAQANVISSFDACDKEHEIQLIRNSNAETVCLTSGGWVKLIFKQHKHSKTFIE